MTRICVYLCGLTCLLQAAPAFGQESLDMKRFDPKKVERMILEKINEVRDTSGAPALEEDPILRQAAVSQAEYIVDEGSFTRYQDDEELKDVEARVHYFGGKHSVVEEMLTFHSVRRTRTYESLVLGILRRWFGSSSYFDKIKSEGFTNMGFTAVYDKKNDKVYAALVLGDEPFTLLDGFPVPEDVYGIRQLERGDARKYCGECTRALRNMDRANVTVNLVREGEDIYFTMSDGRFFEELFSDGKDGVAVDVVIKPQFRCGKPNVEMHPWAYKGLLLPPVYRSELEAGLGRGEEPGSFKVRVGRVPSIVRDRDFEMNLLIVQRRYRCHYQAIYDKPPADFAPLTPRLLRTDSAARFSEKAKALTTPTAPAGSDRPVTIRYELFYDNDKVDYSLPDLRDLFDSLRLSEYRFEKLEITAYTPIEGKTIENMRRQEERVQSIYGTLQGIQTDSIDFSKKILEDWYGFTKSVSRTKHYKLAEMPSFKIKEELQDKQLREDLAEILRQNRKIAFWAVLMKRETPFDPGFGDRQASTNASADTAVNRRTQLKRDFARLVKANDAEGLTALQAEVFGEVQDEKLTLSFLDSLPIPAKPHFRLALENRALFWRFMKEEAVEKPLFYYVELAGLFPGDSIYAHNSVALQLESWSQGDTAVAPYLLAKKVASLERRFNRSEEAMRLSVNLRMCQSLLLGSVPDSMADYVSQNYAVAGLKQEGAVQVSKMLLAAGRPDVALQVVKPYATLEEPDEDVIFLYLRMTLADVSHTHMATYRQMLEKAHKANPERFKRLFEWRGAEGGASFQLLGDAPLKKFYCEHCSGEKKAN